MPVSSTTVPIEGLEVLAYEVPTDGPDGRESDGTLEWSSTTCIVVVVRAGGQSGLGYTYGDVSVAHLINTKLASLVLGMDALVPGRIWRRMFTELRNVGRPGVGSMAVAAVDIAVWDLKARLLQLPLIRALPAFHDQVPVYGSGGFTNYSLDRLGAQLSGWTAAGISSVKLKTSRRPREDPARLDAVRRAIGDEVHIFTDANGALSRKDALYWAARFREQWGVVWFEEPVSSDDLEGLRLMRERGPGGLEIAAGEYGFVLADFAKWLEGGCVDCLQADVTRCGGITGLLEVSGLSAAKQIDMSAHCAPAISAHAFCAVERLRHLEYFHDHVRIESMIFDGTIPPVDSALRPDQSVPGHGLVLRRPDPERFQVFAGQH